MTQDNLKDIEYALIGICLKDETAFEKVRKILDDDCFTNSESQTAWQIMCQLTSEGHGLSDELLVCEGIKKGKPINFELLEKLKVQVQTENVECIANTLLEEKEKREYVALTSRLDEKIKKGECSSEDIQHELNKFLERKTALNKDAIILKDSIIELHERIENNIKGEKLEGTLTGFDMFDNTNGFHKGEFITIAGATSHGKTSFALTITLNAIRNGYKIAYYSLEMDHVSLTARLTAMVSRVPASDMLYKRLTSEQFQKVETAMKSLPFRNLFYDDNSTSSFENITSSIRMMKKKYDIVGAVVDYLQILNVNTKSKDTKEQIMAGIARKFKNLALELGIWIIGLSQLNRDKENPQPRIDRLRDSGQIAEASDIVVFVYRPELYGRGYDFENKVISPINTALIDIAKGRNIGIGNFIVDFEPTLTHFTQHKWTDAESKAKEFWKNEHNKKAQVEEKANSERKIARDRVNNQVANQKESPKYVAVPEEPDIPFVQENPNEKLPF